MPIRGPGGTIRDMGRWAVLGEEPTSFVGRGPEEEKVGELLAGARVVTLTGPGGVGKTRLARRVARAVANRYPDGAHLVPLADLRDPALLPNAVAQALGRSDGTGATTTATLVDHLATRRLLLVLDNCEHLVDRVAALVHQLLLRTTQVDILATSRQSLGTPGEQLFVVPPLAVGDDETPTEELGSIEGVRLFVQRAQAVVPDLQLVGDQLRDAAALVRQLDGLPLAIELAAARMRVLSVRQITERLRDGLALLAGGARTAPARQQTMRAAIDGSRELCSPAEVAVWARASVFAGSFDLEAAEQVCGGGEAGDVLAALDGLVDKSILTRSDSDEQIRFRLLEPLREYGAELLASSGQADAVNRRHRDWYDDLAAKADAAWLSPDQITWLHRMHADHANLRAALGWSVAHADEPARTLAMATRVHDFLITFGVPGEARAWIERALDHAPADLPGRARALALAAISAAFHADLDLCLTLADQAQAYADPEAAPYIDHARAFVALLRVQPDSATAARAVEGYAAAGEPRRTMHPMFLQALMQAIEGDAAGGRSTLARMADLCRPEHEANYRAMAALGQAIIELWFFDDPEAAAGPAREAVQAGSSIPGRLGLAYDLDVAAWVASRRGQHRRAAVLFGAASSIWESAGVTPDVAMMVAHDHFLGQTRAALGEDVHKQLHDKGRSLPIEVAVGFALDEKSTLADRDDTTEPSPLTRREREIAALVAQGMTNRAIAEQLVIALRTVDTHVQNMLTKLDLRNRTELATWVTRREAAPTGR